MAATVVKEKPLFHLQVLFTEELYSGEFTPIRGTEGISLQIVTIVIIYIYSCCLQLFLYLYIFIDKINLFDCCYTSKLYIYCIYSVFIENSHLFLCIVNQYMYSKFK